MKKILLITICLLAAAAAFAQSNTDTVRQFERLMHEWKSASYNTGSEKYAQLKAMMSEGCKMSERIAKAYIDEFNASTIDIRANAWLQYIKEKRISISLRDLREETGKDGSRIVYCWIKYIQPGKTDKEDFVGIKFDGGQIFYIGNDDMERANRLKEDSENNVVEQPPATPGTDLTFTVSGVTFKMKYVQGGTFKMGAQKDNPNGDNYDSDADYHEKPVHTVILYDYYIGETEVTQGLWKAVMGSNPSFEDYGIGDDLPVNKVSWDDCQVFIQKLSQQTGRYFHLPYEAEWEYAARGGSKSNNYKYSGSNTIDDVAWYKDNSGSKIHPVKSKSPNELGIYDMSGNVWEWCSDWYMNDYCANSLPHNREGLQFFRVIRGGSKPNIARFCRVSFRNYEDPSFHSGTRGLRLALGYF